MNHLCFTVVLLIGVILTLPMFLDGSAICEVQISQTRMVSTTVTRTQTVKTYRGNWPWRSNFYRSVLGYKVRTRLLTSYYTIHVCCEGYEGDATQDLCFPISGPEERLSTTTERPTLIWTSKSGQPDVAPSSETTTDELPITSALLTTIDPVSSTTLQINETTSMTRGMGDGLGMMSSWARRQISIMISLFSFAIVIVLSTALGCVVYRRRKRNRIQKEVADRMPAESLRDLSKRISNIQQISPSTAPDETPRVSTPTKNLPKRYENTRIGGKPVDLQSDGQNKEQDKENGKLHTYMDRMIRVETHYDIIPVSMVTVPDNCHSNVDEMQTSKVHTDECYTEINYMLPSSVVADRDLQGQEYNYIPFATSPSSTGCHGEVDHYTLLK